LRELAADRQRPKINADESDAFDKSRDPRLCRRIIAGIEQHARPAILRVCSQDFRAQMIERLNNPRAWDKIGDDLARHAALEVEGLNNGSSIGLLASMTMRPFQFGSPASAAGSFIQLTAMKTTSARGLPHACPP
jgi:hypothetical protein